MTEHVDIRQRFNVPCNRVFPYFADHEIFGKKVAGLPVTRVKSADDVNQPNGVGSVRKILSGPLALEESIVEFVENQRIHYTVSKGGPIKNHLGEIVFTETDSGCEVHYQIRFEGKLPLVAKPVAIALQSGLARNMARLAKELDHA